MINLKKKIIIIAIIGFVIDQLTKFVVINYVDNVNIIPGFLKFIYAKNTGVAFSMLSNNVLLIILISLILLVFLLYELRNDHNLNKISILSYGLLFGGIIGNLFDRIFRGHVIDFISFTFGKYSFAVFNIADILITVGVLLLIIKIIKEKPITGR